MRGHPYLNRRLSHFPYTDAGQPDKKEEEDGTSKDGTHATMDVGVLAIICILVQPLGSNPNRCAHCSSNSASIAILTEQS